MTVLVPPKRTRFWFWTFGIRLHAEYRPWVAMELADPGFLRRRLRAALAVQTVLVLIPQTLLALAASSRLWLIGAAVLIAILVTPVLRRKPMSAIDRQRLLAYHGVNADGTLREPVSPWATSPFGKAAIVLLAAQTLVFTSGIAVAAVQISDRRACHVLTAAHAAALAAVVGQPAPSGAFGAPQPAVAAGAPLIAAREVDTVFPGIRYAAAYARDRSGRLLGPAVWRIIDPNAFGPSPIIEVSAQNLPARQITPSTGHGSSDPEDPALDKARNCAKAAR